jgi:hypothetical protein
MTLKIDWPKTAAKQLEDIVRCQFPDYSYGHPHYDDSGNIYTKPGQVVVYLHEGLLSSAIRIYGPAKGIQDFLVNQLKLDVARERSFSEASGDISLKIKPNDKNADSINAYYTSYGIKEKLESLEKDGKAKMDDTPLKEGGPSIARSLAMGQGYPGY